MVITVETLNILLLLMPGFISWKIISLIFKYDQESIPKIIFDTLILSFLTYLIVSIFIEWEPLATVSLINGKLNYSFSRSVKVISLTSLIVLILPIILGSIYQNDFINSCLRKINVTTKTSRNNTWNDAFLSQDRYVIVTLKDNRRIRGYPTMFSTDPKEGFVYLYNPAWVNDDKEFEEQPDYIESNCHGFLLNRENIDLIEFTLDPGEKLSQRV
jgi:hypothetical protein